MVEEILRILLQSAVEFFQFASPQHVNSIKPSKTNVNTNSAQTFTDNFNLGANNDSLVDSEHFDFNILPRVARNSRANKLVALFKCLKKMNS